MKAYNIVLLFLFMLCGIFANAQTQQGVVKTRGKMVNGKLVPGEGLSGATVLLGDRNVVSNGDNGTFSFPTRGNRYLVKGCKKQGYQLIDMQVCREYKYSDNPLYLVMETPEQQQSDLLTKERSLRRDLQRRLQQREDEVDNLNLSLQEKNRLLQEINRQRDENEKLIKDLAQYYSTLDYDRLDEFQRQVAYLLENNELEKADSMLRSRGSIDGRIREIQREQEAEAKEDAIIAERQKNNDASKAGTRKKLEDVASDCYSFYLRFSQDHQNDSAAHYLGYRAILDTTNIEWQNEAGRFIEKYLADYKKGLAYYRRCLRQAFFQEGEEGKWVATSYNNIGSVYSSQGDYTKALEYFQKSLAIGEKVFGSEHPDIATFHNNIGAVYSSQDDYAKALGYSQKALAIQEKLFGPEHPDIARSYNNIGSVYFRQGDYVKALEYCQKALAIREKLFGPEHPDIAMSYNNIGSVYDDQGDYAKALEYSQKALAIRIKLFGPEHPYVATSYNTISSVYDDQGDYAKALEYSQKALAIQEKLFGPEHPDIATSYNNIGSVYNDQGDYAKALEYYQKALAIWKKLFGPEHPNVATSYNNIGYVYYCQGDYAKALEYYQKALAIKEKLFGMEHPNTKEIKENIGYTEKEMILSNPERMKDYIFTATVVDGDTPARQQQMSGEYVVLEFADWNIGSTTSLFDVNKEMRGKPKTIVVMKNDDISQHLFENTIGVRLDFKKVGQKEKERIMEKYHQWKKQ